jgi:hypothetical protein
MDSQNISRFMRLTMSRNYLFTQQNLDDELRGRTQTATGAVNLITETQFLASSDDEIVEHLKGQLLVEPIALHEDNARMKQSETQVDVSRDPNRIFFPGQSGPIYVAGTRMDVSIPFSGAEWIWSCRTNPFNHNPPTGRIAAGRNGGTLELAISLPHDAQPEQFKQQYEQTMRSIRQHVEWQAAQVRQHNGQVEPSIRSAVAQRRQRLKQHSGLAAIMNIPLQEKTGAPPIQRIPIDIRKPPALPVAPKSGLQPEPGIDPGIYEKILNVIRHEGRTFETTPKTYAKLDEEELRDVVLAHLNGHFQGAATGEAFRRKGKTDIRIEDKERSAFVAECKVWSGASEVKKALEQMLGYLTWRDSKAALVFFNKHVAGFSELPDRLHDAIATHSYFISETKTGSVGEYRFLMRSAEDEGRRVTVHVFLFNVYWKG